MFNSTSIIVMAVSYAGEDKIHVVVDGEGYLIRAIEICEPDNMKRVIEKLETAFPTYKIVTTTQWFLDNFGLTRALIATQEKLMEIGATSDPYNKTKGLLGAFNWKDRRNAT